MLAKNPLAEAWTILDIAKAAELKIGEMNSGASTDCEIAVDMPAQWFLVRSFPGDDARALRWLARRRFGAFRAMQQRRLHGKLVQGWEPVFPGWIFVLCWDIDKMRHRITSTPGVMSILCDPATNRPVPIKEDFIDRLRALSWVYNDQAPHPGHYTVRATRNVARMTNSKRKIDKRALVAARKAKKEIKKLKKALKDQGKWEPSTWASANDLAPAERIALLQRTLNAPSLAA